MITINSEVKNTIDSAVTFMRYIRTGKIVDKTKIDFYDMTYLSTQQVKELLESYPPEDCKFEIAGEGDGIYMRLVVHRQFTQSEILEKLNHYHDNVDYCKQKLLKWMEKPEWKDQILTYLELCKIKIEGIN